MCGLSGVNCKGEQRMSVGQTHGGKGSATRPTNKEKYEKNYDAIFGKNKKKEDNKLESTSMHSNSYSEGNKK